MTSVSTLGASSLRALLWLNVTTAALSAVCIVQLLTQPVTTFSAVSIVALGCIGSFSYGLASHIYRLRSYNM